MSDQDDGDKKVTDLNAFKEKRSKEEVESESEVLSCQKCGDALYWVVRMWHEGQPGLAIFCQHCDEPIGYGFEFDDED